MCSQPYACARRERKPRKPPMANTSDVAADAAVPSSADIERAAAFAREPFLLDGEGPEALAPGTARRRALDASLKELDEGAEHPSIQWRRDFSLLLGQQQAGGAAVVENGNGAEPSGEAAAEPDPAEDVEADEEDEELAPDEEPQ